MKPAVVENLPPMVLCSGGSFEAWGSATVCVLGAGNLVVHANPHADVCLAGEGNVVLCGGNMHSLAPAARRWMASSLKNNRVVILDAYYDALRLLTDDDADLVMPLTPAASHGRTEFPGGSGNLVIRVVAAPIKRRFGDA